MAVEGGRKSTVEGSGVDSGVTAIGSQDARLDHQPHELSRDGNKMRV